MVFLLLLPHKDLVCGGHSYYQARVPHHMEVNQPWENVVCFNGLGQQPDEQNIHIIILIIFIYYILLYS